MSCVSGDKVTLVVLLRLQHALQVAVVRGRGGHQGEGGGVGDAGGEGHDVTVGPVHEDLVLLARHDVVQQVLGLERGQVQQLLCRFLSSDF